MKIAIEKKFELLFELLKKNIADKPRTIYSTGELDEALAKFAKKNKLGYSKKRIRGTGVMDDWAHLQGRNNWEYRLSVNEGKADESGLIVESSDDNGDLNPFALKITGYNPDDDFKTSSIL